MKKTSYLLGASVIAIISTTEINALDDSTLSSRQISALQNQIKKNNVIIDSANKKINDALAKGMTAAGNINTAIQSLQAVGQEPTEAPHSLMTCITSN